MKSSQIFRENVKRLMLEQGIKVKDLSEMVGLSPSYLSLILSGERGNLSDDHKDALALALGATVFELYLPNDDMLPNKGEILNKSSLAERGSSGTPLSVGFGRDVSPFEDLLLALNVADESLIFSFYREISRLTDDEVARFGDFIKGVLSSWQEKKREKKEAPKTGEAGPKKAERVRGTAFHAVSAGLDWEIRRFAGIAASLAKILGDVPLKLIEISSDKSSEKVAEYAARLEEAGLIHMVPENGQGFGHGLVLRFADPEILEKSQEWLSPIEKKKAMARLVQDDLQGALAFLTPLEKGRICLEISDLQKARGFYLEAVEKASSQQNSRLARDLLLVTLSIDRMAGTSKKEAAVVNQMMVTTCLNLNQPEMAKAYQEKNLLLWEASGNREDLVKGYNMMSFILWRMGDWASSSDYLIKALEAAAKDSLSEARIRLSLWGIYKIKGYLAKGKDELERVLDISSRLNDGFLMAEALLGFGSMFIQKGDFAKARTYLNRALALSEKKEAVLEALVRQEIGKLLFLQENFKAASSQFEAAYSLMKARGEAESTMLIQAYAAWCKVRSMWRQGPPLSLDPVSAVNPPGAGAGDSTLENENPKDLLSELFETFKGLRNVEGMVITLVGQGELMFRQGDPAQGREIFRKAIKIARDAEAPYLESQACLSYAECLRELGDELFSVMKERAQWARGKLR